MGDTLVFASTDPSADPSSWAVPQLWRTDGTVAGTYRLKDGIFPSSFASYNGKVYFAGYDPEAGTELWSTDGTEAGTVRVADLWAGPYSSSPQWLTVSDGALWFSADSPLYGREVWKFTPDDLISVTGRSMFYNDSAFDGGDPAGNAGDLSAVAADKAALLDGRMPGSFANVTSYDKGINGVLLQFSGIGRRPRLEVQDLDLRLGSGPDTSRWIEAATPAAITPVPVPGPNTVYSITWPDGAIRNTWLRVTVKANEHTGLAADDVFYFGNLVGETGDAATSLRVSALDLAGIRRAFNTPAAAASPCDINRDGRVNALDLAAVRGNLSRALPQITTAAALTLAAPATDALREEAGTDVIPPPTTVPG
jgi:ELWxxDGT repeat protein